MITKFSNFSNESSVYFATDEIVDVIPQGSTLYTSKKLAESKGDVIYPIDNDTEDISRVDNNTYITEDDIYLSMNEAKSKRIDKCLYCGSSNIEYDKNADLIEGETGEAIVCKDCDCVNACDGSFWIKSHKVTDYEDVRKGISSKYKNDNA